MRTHLWAALAAVILAIAALTGGTLYAKRVEDRYVNALAPVMFNQKNQGAALQDAAFRRPDLLPIYGSSELDIQDPFHAKNVFAQYPTGFTVFPVGKAGTTNLIILEDLAAVGGDLRGKRVVISLSAPWFFGTMQGQDSYAGNFSKLHAGELAFSGDLSFAVRQGAARRMLQYPKTLQGLPILTAALHDLASGSPLARAQYYAIWPIGRLENAVWSLQDHWETLRYIQSQRRLSPNVKHQSAKLNWPALLSKAEAQQEQNANNNPFGFDNQAWNRKFHTVVKQAHTRNDTQFDQSLQHSLEWTDLDLLLRGLKDMGARPLLLSMPIQGTYYDFLGVSPAARDLYYRKLEQTAAAYDVPVLDFAGHDSDKYFLIDPGAHLSREGWIYYDEALDNFAHGRLD